jgi:shikimate 5-dehydrogenase
VQRRFFLLGSAPQVSVIGAGMQTALAERLSASCEPLEVQRDSRSFRAALSGDDFAGMQLATRHSPLCYPLCDDYSVAALTTGVVDVIVRQPDGRLYGDYVLAAAMRELLRSEGIATVRTGLIFGAGLAARAAVVALKDLGCARFVIGHLTGKRQVEFVQQFRRMRKQFTFFPLREMAQFIEWAEAHGAFVSDQVPPTEFSGAERAADKGAKRWELLVNTCPPGATLLGSGTPLASHNFMFGVNRVLDVTSSGEPTQLVSLARHMGITALTGERLTEIHRGLVLELLERTLRGEDLDAAVPMQRRRRYTLHRRKVN